MVFDGYPRQGLTGPSVGLRVEYALRAGADSADDRIVEMVAQTPQKSEVLVYTSDRALRQRILALGARVEGSSVLLKALNKQP